MPSHHEAKTSRLKKCLREARLDSHPMTIPDSDHILHQSNPRPHQAVRPGHRSRATTLALILIAVMAAVAGSLTWAYFSDTATTTATFSTGTVDLQICDEFGCYPSLPLDPMTDIYPGWSETITLGLKNVGSLAMNVSFQASEGEEDDPADLGSVIEVAIYKAMSADPGAVSWPTSTINSLESAGPVEYGALDPDSPQPITFVFTWPETGEDQTGFAGASLDEQITFYGTTQGVEQD